MGACYSMLVDGKIVENKVYNKGWNKLSEGQYPQPYTNAFVEYYSVDGYVEYHVAMWNGSEFTLFGKPFYLDANHKIDRWCYDFTVANMLDGGFNHEQ
jgi:hypothetical protein